MKDSHCDGTWEPPNALPKCTWKPGDDLKNSPHHHLIEKKVYPKVLPNVLEHIGNVPMVRLDRIAKKYGIECNLYGKCEYLNPGGSIKDRIGYRMVVEAHRDGKLVPGCTLIEPTSGNTGIGIALAAAVLGYKCIILLPEKMSKEKTDVLKGLGAEVVRTRTSAEYYEEDSHIRIAQKLRDSIPNAVILNQYTNPYNSIAHFDNTGEDIIFDCDGKIDAVVLSAGTGGSVCGISYKVKEKLPHCKIYAVDPVGSLLALPESLNDDKPSFYEVEGIGYEFIPSVLHRELIDEWIKVDDKQALPMARDLIRLEGILCGGSSGTNVYAAVQVAKKMKKGETCVVILPDSVRNYLSKFLNDSWMIERDFMPSVPLNENSKKWWDIDCSTLKLRKDVEPISEKLSLRDALERLESDESVSALPVCDDDKKIVGTILTSKIHTKIGSSNDDLKSIILKDSMETLFKKAYLNQTKLGTLYHTFDSADVVIILSCPEKKQMVGLITKTSFMGQISRL